MPKPYSNTIAAALDALGEDEVMWHPLDMMGVIADLIDGMVSESTTQLYGRRSDEISLDEVEKISI